MLFSASVIHGQFQEREGGVSQMGQWFPSCDIATVAANCATHLQRGRAKNIKAQFQFQPQSSVTQGDAATKAFQT